MKITRLGVAAVALVVAGACSDAPTELQLVEGTSEARAGQSLKAAESPTLVDVALSVNAETGEFSTLIAAVVDAGLVDALSAVGQRTVFAPTDAAFEALGLTADNIGEALGDDVLKDVLLYHVANGRLYAEEVVTKDRLRMLNGEFTEIDGTTIDGATIVITDVEASNGIIHVIDAVLLP